MKSEPYANFLGDTLVTKINKPSMVVIDVGFLRSQHLSQERRTILVQLNDALLS